MPSMSPCLPLLHFINVITTKPLPKGVNDTHPPEATVRCLCLYYYISRSPAIWLFGHLLLSRYLLSFFIPPAPLLLVFPSTPAPVTYILNYLKLRSCLFITASSNIPVTAVMVSIILVYLCIEFSSLKKIQKNKLI